MAVLLLHIAAAFFMSMGALAIFIFASERWHTSLCMATTKEL
jgi:hypothetical protein